MLKAIWFNLHLFFSDFMAWQLQQLQAWFEHYTGLLWVLHGKLISKLISPKDGIFKTSEVNNLFHRAWGGTEWPVSFPALLEEGTDICSPSVFKNLSQSLDLLKIIESCSGICQLTQHLWVHPIRVHGLMYIQNYEQKKSTFLYIPLTCSDTY